MDNLQVYYKSKSWRITNAWFQQYEKNSYHEYHNHTQTNFTNVYFLELPDTNFKTIIKISLFVSFRIFINDFL